MKLTFIGTSHGVPEAHRRCSCCILESGGSRYIIDMGTQVIEDLRRMEIDVASVRLAACTHPHGDHTSGLFSFADLVNWYFKDAKPQILLSDAGLTALLRTWITVSNNGKQPREGLRIETYAGGLIYADENLRLTAIPTRHCANSYALLAEADGKKVLFTGDLRHPSVDFPAVAFETELDLIVCELAHFSPDDCVPVFDRTKAKRVLHNHINDGRWREALDRQLAQPHPYQYGEARDGLTLTIA